MKVRRFLAFICYTICLAAYGTCGYISYISWENKITHRFGFLLFLPVWIIAFWFSTFFTQLLSVKLKNKKEKILCPKLLYSFLNNLTSLVSVVLLGFWAYIMYVQYRNTGTFM